MISILKNKNCLLTGATGGIGRELAKQLSKENCNLFLTSTSSKKLIKLKNELETSTSSSIFYKSANFSNSKDLVNLVKEIRKTMKNVDILINCAGIFKIKSISKSTVEDYDSMFNVNVKMPFILSKEFSKDMIKKKWGRIINIGSSSSYSGFENGSLYCSSKHAVLGLSRSLQSELKQKNVRVLCISPGSTQTNMGKISKDQDFNTFLSPEEVARYIIFSLSFDKEMVIDESRLNRMTIK
jgi:short-subunit dehydrogenase